MSSPTSLLADDAGEEPLIPRRRFHDHAEFDITAMIDLVFMMNIYFLVTSISALAADIDLPPARNTVVADHDSSVVITILAAKDGRPAGVLIGDDTEADLITDPGVQQREVQQAVEEGARTHMSTVIIRAEINVPLREVMRVARVVAAVEGMQLKVSVVEKE